MSHMLQKQGKVELIIGTQSIMAGKWSLATSQPPTQPNS